MNLFNKIFIILVGFVIFSFSAQSVFAGAPDAAHSSVTATEVPADGTTASTITVTIHDSSDVPVSGDVVYLQAPSDATFSLNPPTTTLDASGIATFSATSTQAGTDPLTFKDSTQPTSIVALGNVIFDPLPQSAPVDHNASNTPACSDSVPVGAPDLYQVTPKDTSTTLYFSPPNTKYDGFNISYGLTSSANSYGVHMNQVQVGSALSYTVNSLYPKTPYYFKIRATNGCAVGPWSGTVASLNVSNIKKLPETGPNQFLLFGGIGGVITLLGVMMVFVL